MNNATELKTQKIEFMDMMRDLGLEMMEKVAERYPEGFDAFLSIAKQGGERVKLIPECVGFLAYWTHKGDDFNTCLDRIEANFKRMGI